MMLVVLLGLSRIIRLRSSSRVLLVKLLLFAVAMESEVPNDLVLLLALPRVLWELFLEEEVLLPPFMYSE